MASFANVTEQVGLIKVTDSELALIVNEEVLSNSNEKDAKKKNLSLTLKWESSLNPNVEAKGVSCTTSKRTINGANRKETIFT